MWTPKMDSADSQVVSDNAIPHPSLPAAVPMSDAVRAKPRGHIIAVTSGKGGVGKTSTSAALGIACADAGYATVVVSAGFRIFTRSSILLKFLEFHRQI